MTATAGSLERTMQILEKMTLYGITTKYINPGESEFRYRWTSQFIDHINIIGEIMRDNPEFAKACEGDRSKKAELEFMFFVICKFLAIERLQEQWAAGEPDWKVKSSMNTMTSEDIYDEMDKIDDNMTPEEYAELLDITKMVCSKMESEMKEGDLTLTRRKGA